MKRLGYTNSRDNMSHVTDFGGGSSFIGMRVEQDTKRYLRRWDHVKLPSAMKQAILQDKELQELNLKLFGTKLSDDLR